MLLQCYFFFALLEARAKTKVAGMEKKTKNVGLDFHKNSISIERIMRRGYREDPPSC